LYAVRNAAPYAVTSIDLGTAGAQMYLPSGWSRAEVVGDTSVAWAVSRQASLLMRLAPGAAAQNSPAISPSIGERGATATLALRAAPFSYPGAPTQKITIAVNGRAIGTVELADGWHEYRLPVAAAGFIDGINQIRLTFDHLASPAQVLGSSDTRTLAAAVDWLRLE
jgi:hypothetical protein